MTDRITDTELETTMDKPITKDELDEWESQCRRNISNPTIHEMAGVYADDDVVSAELLPNGSLIVEGRISSAKTLRLIAEVRRLQAIEAGALTMRNASDAFLQYLNPHNLPEDASRQYFATHRTIELFDVARDSIEELEADAG